MKRILSWIVLYLISILTGLLTSLVVGIGSYILRIVNDLNTFWKLLAYFFGGTAFLSFIFLPIHYGSSLAVFTSEAIKNSNRGLRYIVFSAYMLITSVVYIIIQRNKGIFALNVILMCFYYIALMLIGKSINDNGKDTVLTEQENENKINILKKQNVQLQQTIDDLVDQNNKTELENRDLKEQIMNINNSFDGVTAATENLFMQEQVTLADITSVTEPPYLDINGLAFADDDEIRNAQKQYAEELYKYFKAKEQRGEIQ